MSVAKEGPKPAGMRRRQGWAPWLAVVLSLLLSACAGTPPPQPEPPQLTGAWGIRPPRRVSRPPVQEVETPPAGPIVRRLPLGEKAPLPGQVPRVPPPAVPGAKGKGRVMSFKDAPLAEVIPVFAELLGIKIVVPPGLKGSVTLYSGGAVRADELLPLLVTILELNGYALVHQDGVFRVLPLRQAKYSPMLPESSRALGAKGRHLGYGLEVFYLTYLSANRAAKTVRRFISKAGDVSAVQPANALVVAETASNLAKVRRLIRLLDVPISQRVGIRVYHIRNVPVTRLAKDLRSIVAAMGISQKPKSGVWMEIVPLPELSSIAVISSVREMFAKVERWLADLDRQIADAQMGVYVYHCQSGDATTIAEVLTALYGVSAAKAAPRRPKPKPTPGAKPVTGRRPTTISSSSSRLHPLGRSPSGSGEVHSSLPEPKAPVASELEGGVRIVVEPNTNAIVIRAPRHKYESLLRTIRKLDVFPRQVLIEVLIAEVSLDGAMELGVEWQHKTTWGGRTLEGSLGYDKLGLTPVSGLVYTITQADQLKATLRALAQQGKVNVISSPILLSAENQESRINVGEEVPIITDVTVSQDLTNPDTGTKITDRSIKYRDTGITLSVTPRINDSGLVKLQVVQEISDIAKESFGKTESPSFFKRSASTNVITTDGQAIVIAGLIRNRIEEREAGVPFLSQIPILGYLFKTTKKVRRRTELVITLTPHVIHDMADAKAILEDLRDEMQRLRKPFVGTMPLHTLGSRPTPAEAKSKGQAPQPAEEP